MSTANIDKRFGLHRAVATRPSCELKACLTDGGLAIRVQGQGTLRESAALYEWAHSALEGDAQSEVSVDLSRCTYLDSTFLGCLVALHREANATPGDHRFFIVADEEHRHQLLGALKLDEVLDCRTETPATQGAWVNFCKAETTPRELGRHALACHQHLASTSGAAANLARPILGELTRALNE